MSDAFIIWTSVVITIAIIIIFILGLFTHISPSLLLIMMYVFLLFVFILSAGYAADAAGKTGGSGADSANKTAHEYYTWAAVISWVTVGFTVLAIIAGIIIAIIGAPEEAAAGAAVGGAEAGVVGVEATAAAGAAGAAETTGTEVAADLMAEKLAGEGINAAESKAASEAISSTKEGKDLATRIGKEKKANKSLFDTGHGFSKFIHVILYIIIGITIALAFTVGLLLAIGAGIQGGSSDKKGLKKAAIGASMSMFIAGMYVILFIVMWAKGKSVHKRLGQDLAKQEELTRQYLQQRQAGVSQAKGQYARELIGHHFGTPGVYPTTAGYSTMS